MELWFSEMQTKNVKFSIKVKEQLYSGKSDFQRIDVFKTKEFGRILVLDGCIMCTEKDEFIYHEMITHVPMAVKPDVKRVLVIGAGDGGTLRELTRYETIEKIDLVEIDEQVVKVSKEFLPFTACGFDDKRVNLYFQDGLKFVRGAQDEYDLIIVDSTDPFGPGEGLFTKEFYGNCHKALRSDGILVNQLENVYYSSYARATQSAFSKVRSIFGDCHVYQVHIPTYPSGHWLFGFSSKSTHPVSDIKQDLWNNLGIKTRYYNTELHKGSFCLPNYVLETLMEE